MSSIEFFIVLFLYFECIEVVESLQRYSAITLSGMIVRTCGSFIPKLGAATSIQFNEMENVMVSNSSIRWLYVITS